MSKQAYVYIMTNGKHAVLYTGETSDLIKRVYQHKEGVSPGFTKTYKASKLVYYEIYGDIFEAIKREKQIKAGSRKKKIDLINLINPQWRDLYETLFR
jgi:putative endonuclease